MSRKGALAMLVVTVLWAVTPAIACMIPTRPMTQAERECCKKMAEKCGSSAMPSSHSCCKATTHQADSYVAKSRFTSGHDQHLSVPLIAATYDLTPESFSQARSVAQAHSPPVSDVETISILRI